MKINHIIQILEEWAPTIMQKTLIMGLLVGDKSRSCTAALITHDVSVAVVEEAISNNCNLIVAFIPLYLRD